MSDLVKGSLTEQRSGIADTAFRENLVLPVHRWVPWIGGYSASFVKDCISLHLSRPGRIYDPFAGVGTTLLEAVRSGHQAVGVELNPYAALAAKTKCASQKIDVGVVVSKLADLEQDWETLSAERIYPKAFGTREPFFSEKALRGVNRTLNWIDSLTSGAESDLMRLALGALVVSVSNYAYGPSLSTRSKAGKPENKATDVKASFESKVNAMIEDIRAVQLESAWATSAITIGNSNIDYCPDEDSIDLVVTSPPYLNNYHYVRNSRPQMFFLNLIASHRDLRGLQENNFGKYWQTVRGSECPKSDYDCKEAEQVVDKLVGHRSEAPKLYRGLGWASYVRHYFNDCLLCLQRVKSSLKPGGAAVFVLGDSYLQGVHVPVESIFTCIAVNLGFELISCSPARIRHGGATVSSRKNMLNKNKVHLIEYVITLRKP